MEARNVEKLERPTSLLMVVSTGPLKPTVELK